LQVAVSLANDEYEDFPIIKDEILEAARIVLDGSGQMGSAVKWLESGREIERAWDAVSASVSAMATRTSQLLHIVYGAEIKRVFACSANAANAIEQLAQGAKKASADDDESLTEFVEGVKREAAKLKVREQ
jgi:hypothetical protein